MLDAPARPMLLYLSYGLELDMSSILSGKPELLFRTHETGTHVPEVAWPVWDSCHPAGIQ